MILCMLGEHFLPPVAPAQWRDKGEKVYMPMEHAAYAKPDYRTTKKNLTPSTARRHEDPLSRHRLSYLNGGGGSGKTTRAIEFFRQKAPLVFTPTHRLAKEMRARGSKAQTYHSFFRWSGQTEWTPERMGQKYIPRVIIWNEVCTVSQPILETFLDCLDGRGVQVVFCDDQGQPPPIAGEMQHDWLRRRADYYEVLADHRAKEPALKALKREIRLQPDRVQCQAMRKALPACLGWDRFMEAWKPGNLILTSRQKVGDRAQQLLFERHQEAFPQEPVPLPPNGHADTKYHHHNPWQVKPGRARPERRCRGALEICPRGPRRQVGPGLGSWLCPYGPLKPRSHNRRPTNIWIIDDYLQWSNLAYLAVSSGVSQPTRARGMPLGGGF
ncbi:MAG: AAA family ATPase [Candidatus Thiodiazotropha sp.]